MSVKDIFRIFAFLWPTNEKGLNLRYKHKFINESLILIICLCAYKYYDIFCFILNLYACQLLLYLRRKTSKLLEHVSDPFEQSINRVQNIYKTNT